MRLDQELVLRGLASSRTEAQELVEEGHVRVNGEVCIKQSRIVYETDDLQVEGGRQYVSRGGKKLEGALSHAGIDPKGMVVLDVGSSTGGFTDCLLQRGASSVVAVDVGTDQLHGSLRKDARVTLHEQTDIREFISDTRFDLVVGDLSFIPLEYVVPSIARLSAPGTLILFLIKPQFEVGKGNTKKGIVRNEELYDGVLERIKESFEECFDVRELFPSDIAGGDGNREFLIYAKRKK